MTEADSTVEQSSTPPAAQRGAQRTNQRQVVGALITFGITVGVLTALSEGDGTAIALLGLLFTLIGGSLISLYKGDALKPKQRDDAIKAAGVLSLGILAGLTVGFSAKLTEEVTRSLNATTQPSITRDNGASGGRRIVVLQGSGTTKLVALRGALRDQQEVSSLPSGVRSKLTEFEKAINNTGLSAAVNDVAALIQDSNPAINTRFRNAFVAMFGDPSPAEASK
jgi:hypothetical protein